MFLDANRLWHVVESGDPRFDGWVYCGVTSTGIYCRPSCPARTPKRENVRFFATAAAAQTAGFRACKRCRPDATPGSPEWDRRSDVVGRAMRLIADGLVDREGVSGLAARLGYSERHLNRQLAAVVGAGPLALARAQRAQTARVLLETTAMSTREIAFAAGFKSVRQFNATVQSVFATTPSRLRSHARRLNELPSNGSILLRLPFREPFGADELIAFLGRRAVPGVEELSDGALRRSLRLPNGTGIVELRPGSGHVQARFYLENLRDLAAASQRTRALLDLDSDPLAVAEVFDRDRLLSSEFKKRPGLRVPGHVDAHELAVRAVLGQQVSLTGAAALAGRLVEQYGVPLARPIGGVTHTFPTVAALAEIDPQTLAMPGARKTALTNLTAALASGQLVLDAGVDRNDARQRLVSFPGIGPWTADYIAMRALRDPDVFLASDLGVRHAIKHLGQDDRPAATQRLAERWHPYRSYAVQLLWAVLDTAKPVTSLTNQPAATGLAA